MEKMIAKCGLNCYVCPVFIATKNNDNELRVKTAKEWSEMFNADIKPEHINCLGCLESDSTKRSVYCSQCEIRKCTVNKKVENCAHCDSYETCETIRNLLSHSEVARKNLEEIRKTL